MIIHLMYVYDRFFNVRSHVILLYHKTLHAAYAVSAKKISKDRIGNTFIDFS